MSLAETINVAGEIANTILARIASPLLIIFAGIAIGAIVRNILYKFLISVKIDIHAKKALKYRAEYAELISGGVASVIYTVSIIWGLVTAGIIIEVLWIIVGALGMLALLSLFLAIRDLLPDYIAYFRVKKKLKKGSKLSVDGVTGKVERINWQEVRLRDSKKRLIVIPNRRV